VYVSLKKLLLIVNEDRFFLSHRTRVALSAAADGWDVTVVTKDTGHRKEIERLGLKYLEFPVNPTGTNPIEEIKTFLFLLKLYKRNQDAVIHQVGLKSMLWGGLASRLAKTRGVVYAVSGLGSLFGENTPGIVSRIILGLLGIGMRKKNIIAIFQNHEDESMFVENGTVTREKIVFIKGSGVDLDEFAACRHEAEGRRLVVTFTGRMLMEKGVGDLISAAEMLREQYHDKVEFWICGGLSSNPSALREDDLKRMTDGDYIRWLGHRDDICDILKRSDIMCFPSYYREGVPKSLIEASASGLPIVTTDSVGCRDTVEDGKNGILVPPHSPSAIASALKTLIEDDVLRLRMGEYSRKKAVSDYDVKKVCERHLEIYRRLNRNRD